MKARQNRFEPIYVDGACGFRAKQSGNPFWNSAKIAGNQSKSWWRALKRGVGGHMIAVVQTFSRFSHAETKPEPLKIVATLVGVGIFTWLVFATYGLDLSPGFF